MNLKGEGVVAADCHGPLVAGGGGLKGKEIGRMMGMGNTAVSQEGRRLRARLWEDRSREAFLKRIEQ